MKKAWIILIAAIFDGESESREYNSGTYVLSL